MNALLKVGLSLIALLGVALIIPSVSAFPFTSNVSGPASVSMLEGMTVNVPLDINNGDFHAHHVTITTDPDSGFIDAEAILDEFEMAPYQFTRVGISIRASEDAEHDSYRVNVIVDMDGQTQTVPITVYVGTNPFLNLNPFTRNVCANEYVEQLTVSVKNNQSSIRDVELHAEQPILFPTFEDKRLHLGAGETKLVELEVNVSPSNTGEYKGTVTADTNEIRVVRPIVVKVNDCPTPTPRIISLELPKTTKDVKKNQDNPIPLKIKNLTNEAQSVTVFANSIIPTNTLSMTLGPNETANVNLVLSPDYSVQAGIQSVQVTASASGYTTTQTMNVRVLPIDLLVFENVSNAYQLARGQTKTIALILHNRGDSTQNVTFAMQNQLPGVNVTFTPATTGVESFKSVAVQVSISIEENAPLSSVNTAIQALGSKSTGSAPLSFTIVNAHEDETTLLEFVSLPQFIEMEKDAKKEIVFSLHNPTDESISNVHFKLGGVKGASISVISAAAFTIAPHETKTVTLILVTQEDTPVGNYSPILIAEGTRALGTAPFTLEVREAGALGLFTGLAAFISARAFWAGLIVLLAIAIVWAYNWFRDAKKPIWAGKKAE